jgi:hypothetical protein
LECPEITGFTFFIPDDNHDTRLSTLNTISGKARVESGKGFQLIEIEGVIRGYGPEAIKSALEQKSGMEE